MESHPITKHQHVYNTEQQQKPRKYKENIHVPTCVCVWRGVLRKEIAGCRWNFNFNHGLVSSARELNISCLLIMCKGKSCRKLGFWHLVATNTQGDVNPNWIADSLHYHTQIIWWTALLASPVATTNQKLYWWRKSYFYGNPASPDSVLLR